MKTHYIAALSCLIALTGFAADLTPVKVGTYPQEIGHTYTTDDGLPSDIVNAVAVAEDGTVYAGTGAGLARFDGERWNAVPGAPSGTIYCISLEKNQLAVATDNTYYVPAGDDQWSPITNFENPPRSITYSENRATHISSEGAIFYSMESGLSIRSNYDRNLPSVRQKVEKQLAGENTTNFTSVAATEAGLYESNAKGWKKVFPQDGDRSWAPTDVRAVLFASNGDLWFASPQGVGRRSGDTWTLFEGKDGLPYNDFTCMAEGPEGEIWFGTTNGAIRYDGEHWAFREGLRWLPDNHINDIAVGPNGDTWFATAKGVGRIERHPMTLAEKAKFFEDEIDKYNRRTPYGYVVWAPLGTPGDKSTATRRDDDNDGQWTAEYGAAECFAYAATKDPKAKARATAAFEALRFLSQVTQGGSNPAPKGFPARTIWPTDSPRNPNEDTEYTIAHQEKKQQGDSLWKVIDPRWPTSEDGKWYWKCDTSSDDLDGHYFLYACYFDLVAETDEEKARVAAVVRDMTDHLIDHEFKLVDHDGKPTRWARYGPDTVNADPNYWPEHGLNSMSMLSYLRTAAHITGDQKYNGVADDLIENHGYAMNSMFPKYQKGPGSFVQFDDEMAFMNYYNLLAYETDPKVREMMALSWRDYWEIEVFERNPFYNFAFAARCTGATFTSPWGTRDLTPDQSAIDDSVDTLKRYPMNLINWKQTNSHRLDILPLSPVVREGDESKGKGYKRDGKVLPIDERFQHVWSDDSWELDSGGDGNQLATGMPYLLGYYMGLYHGYIEE